MLCCPPDRAHPRRTTPRSQPRAEGAASSRPSPSGTCRPAAHPAGRRAPLRARLPLEPPRGHLSHTHSLATPGRQPRGGRGPREGPRRKRSGRRGAHRAHEAGNSPAPARPRGCTNPHPTAPHVWRTASSRTHAPAPTSAVAGRAHAPGRAAPRASAAPHPHGRSRASRCRSAAPSGPNHRRPAAARSLACESGQRPWGGVRCARRPFRLRTGNFF